MLGGSASVAPVSGMVKVQQRLAKQTTQTKFATDILEALVLNTISALHDFAS